MRHCHGRAVRDLSDISKIYLAVWDPINCQIYPPCTVVRWCNPALTGHDGSKSMVSRLIGVFRALFSGPMIKNRTYQTWRVLELKGLLPVCTSLIFHGILNRHKHIDSRTLWKTFLSLKSRYWIHRNWNDPEFVLSWPWLFKIGSQLVLTQGLSLRLQTRCPESVTIRSGFVTTSE